MPSATTAKKSSIAGVKRKAESSKDKYTKKPKVTALPVRELAKKGKSAKSTKIEEHSEDDSDDLEEEGGAPLGDSDELEGREDTKVPSAKDGIHPDRLKAAANGAGPNGTSSRESHAKQKQAALERKAAKPLADQLARSKKLWEQLRRKSHVPLAERKKLIEELFEIITGRIKDFVLKHDSVRVVQTAIKYANLDQRKMIAKELAGSYRQLAESKYAKFLIGKLLTHGDDEIRDIVVPEFFGNVRRMMKHPEASWILDDVYRGIATKSQKAIILREWYGAEFALFQKEAGDKVTEELSEILAEDPGKRAPIMRSLQELINHLIQKKMTGFTLLHDAMLQYFLNAKQGTEEITDYIELIKGDEEGDLLKNLAFTRSGSRVVCLTLAYGNAKDRKQILKTYKDTLHLMAGDPNAHIVILAAYEVIDDTVLTSKSIFPELLGKDAERLAENIVLSANDLYARTTLLYLFQGASPSLFPTSMSVDLDILKEIETIRTTTSKKDPEIRRAELAKALSPHVLNGIAATASDLVASSFGCQFITEVLFAAAGDKSAALEAVAATAGGDPSATVETAPEAAAADSEEINMHTYTTPQTHVASTPFGGKMLRTLIAGGRYDSKIKAVVSISPPLNFADILYPVISKHILLWATGSSSFVVLALLESEKFSSKDEVLETLKTNKKVLEKTAKEETSEQKIKREEFEAKKDEMVKKGKKVKVQEREVGNKGSKLLLAMLK